MEDTNLLPAIRRRYPVAIIAGCSAAGAILGTRIVDKAVVITAIQLSNASLRCVSQPLVNPGHCYDVGRRLGQRIEHDYLRHAVVFSEGLRVNGTHLARGLRDSLPGNVPVTGGLAADGEAFEQTIVMDNETSNGHVVLLGFYGDSLKIGYGSLGGWDPFGPDRLITRSNGNILYELDGENALALYKKYLGPYATGLPASGLRFPMQLEYPQSGQRVVRTLLGVNEEEQSLIFAGDTPEGCYATLMKANLDRLVDGASVAASNAVQPLNNSHPGFALLISCVGRRMVLKERAEDELDAAREALGEKTILCGFYSYGELSPLNHSVHCELHNQTMTITAFQE